MKTLTFVASLPENLIRELKDDYYNRIEAMGIYTPVQVLEFVADLKNQKIVDIEDSVDHLLYAYARLLAVGTPPHMIQKVYKRYDLQDLTDYVYETFEQIREGLADFWAENPDEELEDEEQEEHVQRILATTCSKELDKMLQGIGYAMDEVTI